MTAADLPTVVGRRVTVGHGALLEGCVYDKETGQLLTGSYNDYAMPRAEDFPPLRLRWGG